MKVALKVIGGKNDGKEIGISISRFIIGRGETAHLRPASDLVSREHTSIEVRGGQVVITDLKSRNGTFVNGVQISAAHVAQPGDSIRIGRLQFEMLIDQAEAGSKKPRVISVVDAASRTASSNPKQSLEDSISDWLMDSEDEGPSSSEREILKSADTIQLNFEDTTAIQKSVEEESLSKESAAEESKTMFGKKAKPKPLKLPPIEKQKHENSTSAADDVLRKFFNRR